MLNINICPSHSRMHKKHIGSHTQDTMPRQRSDSFLDERRGSLCASPHQRTHVRNTQPARVDLRHWISVELTQHLLGQASYRPCGPAVATGHSLVYGWLDIGRGARAARILEHNRYQALSTKRINGPSRACHLHSHSPQHLTCLPFFHIPCHFTQISNIFFHN